MFLFRTKQNAQRKYVDLIKEAAAKWPNWDPPRNIRVSIAIDSRFVSGFLTVHPKPYSQVTLAPSTKRRGSWWWRETYIPTLTSWDSPASILPFMPPMWINIRFTRMRCRDWTSTPTLECRSQTLSECSFTLTTNLIGDTEKSLRRRASSSKVAGNSVPDVVRSC
jgi:hypothetical protein